MSTVQINIFKPSPSHSVTESVFTEVFFSRSALAGGGGGGRKKNFPPGPGPALGGPGEHACPTIKLAEAVMCVMISEYHQRNPGASEQIYRRMKELIC
jgi:hypothetical protein